MNKKQTNEITNIEISFFLNFSLLKFCSTSPPGGNQVDGLPPVLTFGKLPTAAGTKCWGSVAKLGMLWGGRCPGFGFKQIEQLIIYVTTGGKPSTWFPPGGLVEQNSKAENFKKNEISILVNSFICLCICIFSHKIHWLIIECCNVQKRL